MTFLINNKITVILKCSHLRSFSTQTYVHTIYNIDKEYRIEIFQYHDSLKLIQYPLL